MIKSRKINSTLAALTLCVVSAGWTTAQAQDAPITQPPAQPPSQQTTTAGQPQIASKCTQLIGTTVENPQGQRLGRIADVVVSFDDQRVSYCVMSFRHGTFSRTRYLAVPLAAFQPSVDGTHLILNASRANLANARGFDRNQWPSSISSAWGAEPAAPEALPPVVVFAPAPRTAPASAGYPWVADPAMGPPPTYQSRSASDAIDAMRFQTAFGYVLPGH
jgi:hypothetical protein